MEPIEEKIKNENTLVFSESLKQFVDIIVKRFGKDTVVALECESPSFPSVGRP